MLTEAIIQHLPEEDQAMTRSCQTYYLGLLQGLQGECLSRLRGQWVRDIELRWLDRGELELKTIPIHTQAALTATGST